MLPSWSHHTIQIFSPFLFPCLAVSCCTTSSRYPCSSNKYIFQLKVLFLLISCVCQGLFGCGCMCVCVCVCVCVWVNLSNCWAGWCSFDIDFQSVSSEPDWYAMYIYIYISIYSICRWIFNLFYRSCLHLNTLWLLQVACSCNWIIVCVSLLNVKMFAWITEVTSTNSHEEGWH